MDLSTFDSDADIVKALRMQLDLIIPLDECRLSREEQLQLTEEVIHHRNCVEWLIRANTVIWGLRYALSQSITFAEHVGLPTEESESKRMYSYFLEDAVYRDIVLWDVFRQLLNEKYQCGYAERGIVNIFKFLKKNRQVIGMDFTDSILRYLESDAHKLVRDYLRNPFTHSVDATSMYIFHRFSNGKLQPDVSHIFPKHPFENICSVTEDTIILLGFMTTVVSEMREALRENIALYTITAIMPCGKHEDDPEPWNFPILQDNAERIIYPCSDECERKHKYGDQCVCKPTRIVYTEKNSGQKGEIDLHMSFSELQEQYPEDS